MANVNCVYVLDKNLSVRQGLVRLLQAARYEVRTFAHADEFVDALDRKDVACIVLDAGMPELPIDEMQAVFMRRKAHPPIIVVTTHDDRETKRKAIVLNAAGFFHKPVDGPALLDAIEWALELGQ